MKNKQILFAKRLKQLRTTRGEYMKHLAQHLHMSVGTISNYENGTHCPDLLTLCKIAQYHNVTTDYLLGLTDCPYSVDALNQVISGDYTVDRLLRLLDRLDAKDRAHLAWLLQLPDR